MHKRVQCYCWTKFDMLTSAQTQLPSLTSLPTEIWYAYSSTNTCCHWRHCQLKPYLLIPLQAEPWSLMSLSTEIWCAYTITSTATVTDITANWNLTYTATSTVTITDVTTNWNLTCLHHYKHSYHNWHHCQLKSYMLTPLQAQLP